MAESHVAHVSCEVEADPANVTFRWLLTNAKAHHTEVRTFESDGTRSVASYAPSSAGAYGEMMCWAENRCEAGFDCTNERE